MVTVPDWAATLTAALFAGGGAWTWLTARATAKAKQPADLLAAQAAYQDALGRQADSFHGVMMELVKHQQAELSSLRPEVERLSHAEEECRQRERQLNQKLDSMAAVLEREGIKVTPEKRPDIAEARPLDPIYSLDRGEVRYLQSGEYGTDRTSDGKDR